MNVKEFKKFLDYYKGGFCYDFIDEDDIILDLTFDDEVGDYEVLQWELDDEGHLYIQIKQ